MMAQITHNSAYINGEWCRSTSGEMLSITDSFSEQTFASVQASTPEEVGRAALAAAGALHSWSEVSPNERAEYVRRIGRYLQGRATDVTDAVVREVGTPRKLAARIQSEGPIREWFTTSDLASEVEWERVVGNSRVVSAPVGVVACITPWNYPLHQITHKVAPALLAGCTVVLKPSEIAPLTALILAEAIDAAGIPRGVFNLIHGQGPTVGEALIRHPLVDAISFTGSTAAGRHIAAQAGASIKRVMLELGGKSPSVVLPGANLDEAVAGTLAYCYLNSGQTCSALTRLIIPEESLSAVTAILRDRVSAYTMGDPNDSATRLGPLASAMQRERVRKDIAQAIEAGAVVLSGGLDAAVPRSGYFVAPTILQVGSANPVAQNEVFGPVLSVMTYRTREEATALANATEYGLAAAVWADGDQDALRFARKLRSGQVQINGGPHNPLAPFGGFRSSGIGREGGRYGIEGFVEPIAFQLPIDSTSL